MQVTDGHVIEFKHNTWRLLFIFGLLFGSQNSYSQTLTSSPEPPKWMINSTHLNDLSSQKPLWGGARVLKLSVTLSGNLESTTTTSLHHFDLACGTCHDSDHLGNDITLETNSRKSEVDINNSCTLSGCHEYDPILNHPVDIYPEPSADSDLPLDSTGRMTCLTCHDSAPSNGLGHSKDRPLQIPQGMDFCSSCHSQMPGTQKERAHWQFSSQAHLGHINPNSSTLRRDLATGLLDTESQTCLSCHEDINATIRGDFGAAKHSLDMNAAANHPIGMTYANVVSSNTMRYNRLSKNNQHIRLFDGKMGCGSCHSLYSGMKKHLVQDNRGSRLCFECHNM